MCPKQSIALLLVGLLGLTCACKDDSPSSTTAQTPLQTPAQATDAPTAPVTETTTVAPLDASKGSLTFENTAQWAPELAKMRQQTSDRVERLVPLIELPPAPGNLSEQTRGELEAMLGLQQTARTEAAIKAVEREIDGGQILLGGETVERYMNPQGPHPATAALLGRYFGDLNILTLRQKHHFNRVRPHLLEPRIKPIIEVPGHPAYPSGHATQSWFIARVLSRLRPELTDALMAEAAQVARNREIAGVHYASDSKAGQALADRYLELIAQEPDFEGLIEAARAEWRDAGSPESPQGAP